MLTSLHNLPSEQPEEPENQRVKVNFYPIRNRYLEERINAFNRRLAVIGVLVLLIFGFAALDYLNVGHLRSWLGFDGKQSPDQATATTGLQNGGFAEVHSYFAGHSKDTGGSSPHHTLARHKTAFQQLSGHEKGKKLGYYGIDVSEWQHHIKWNQLAERRKAGSLHFVIIKATQGMTYTDPRYDQNWQGARTTGATLGAYHYFMFDDDPRKQARHFINRVALQTGDLPPIVDVEKNCRSCNQMQTEPRKVLARLKRLLVELEKHYMVTPIIYSNLDFYKRYLKDEFETYTFWLADYTKTPPPGLYIERDDHPKPPPPKRPFVSIWQFTDRGSVPGIVGDVDLNYMPKASMDAIQFVK